MKVNTLNIRRFVPVIKEIFKSIIRIVIVTFSIIIGVGVGVR
jgi:hypothetical protein